MVNTTILLLLWVTPSFLFYSNTLTGEAGKTVTLTRSNALQNLWDISGTYLVIKNLEFVGGSRGLRFGETQDCSDILVENIRIKHPESHAITMNQDGRSYARMTVRNVQVFDTGTSSQ